MRWIGVVFIAYWAYITFYLVQNYLPHSWLWFCPISVLLLGVGFFTKQKRIIQSFFLMGFVAQGYYLSELAIQVFFGPNPSLHTFYMFDYGFLWDEVLINLEHFVSLPLALFVLYNYYDKYAKYIAFFFGAILLRTSYAVSSDERNINCILEMCSWGTDFVFYPIAYITLWVIIIFTTDLVWKHVYDKKITQILSFILIIIALVVVVGYFVRYTGLPQYSCQSTGLECKGIWSYGENNSAQVVFEYTDKCNLEVTVGTKKYQTISFEAKGTTIDSIVIPPPQSDQIVYLQCIDDP